MRTARCFSQSIIRLLLLTSLHSLTPRRNRQGMMMKTARSSSHQSISCLVLLFALSFVSGCGIVSNRNSPSSQSSLIVITPATAHIRAGDTALFVAKANNPQQISPGSSNNPRPRSSADILRPTNSGVTWSVNGIPGGNPTVGTIDAKGLYTAPATLPNPNFARVTATSVAAPSVSATELVTLYNPIPSITSISPTTVSVGGLTLTVIGRGFAKGAQVLFAGAVLQTVFVSPTQLTATGTITRAQVGNVQIAVNNPDPGSVRSATAANLKVTAPFPVQLALSPTNAVLQAGTSLQFRVAVPGTTSGDFAWLADGVVGGTSASGTVSPLGEYTPPPAVTSATSVVLTARSKSDPSESASAIVTVLPAPAPVTISISPSTAKVQTGQSRQLTATVIGTPNSGVSWLVNGIGSGNSAIGTISSTGMYTAPQFESSVPMVTITAKSLYNPGSSAEATITLIAATPTAPSGAGAIYYVNASSGSDSNNGTSTATPWQTVSKVNGSRFKPGDTILFNRGDTWREQLNVSFSGTAGRPIAFGAYGSGAKPLITAFDVIGHFALDADTVYHTNVVTTQPKVVAYNGNLLRFHHVGASVLANEWDWTSNVLYINVGTPTGIVEAGQRNFALDVNSARYIVIDGLALSGGTFASLFLDTNAANDVIQNNDVHHTNQGIATATDSGSNNIIQNNKVHDAVEYGINVFTNAGTGETIQGNEIYNVGGKGGKFTNMQGIFAHTAAGLTITENYIHDGGDSSTADHGIYLSGVDATLGTTTISHNKIANWTACGIKISNSQHADVYGNVISGGGGSGQITVEAGSPSFVNIYNNTIANSNPAGGAFGFWAHAGDRITFKNNIIVDVNAPGAEKSRYNLYIDGSVTNLVSDYNLIWSRTPNGHGYYADVAGVGKTWAQWQALGNDTHSLNVDPIFTNPAKNDFTLLEGSPAIGAGANLGTPYNLGIDNGFHDWTLPLTLADQNRFPTKWTIGAFVF